MDKATITFHDAHIPVLEDGEYDVTVSQKLDSSFDADIADKKVTFNVTGPKFQLNPNQIVSVYPPNAGKGDFMAALPTMALKRSTLPWERSPLSSSKDYSSVNQVQNSSWLFLLLVDESELLSGSVKELNDQSLSGLQNTLGIDSNEVHHLPKKINCLTVNSSLITGDSSLIPITLSELQYLSYARVKNESGEESGEEHAVLLCNRLPKKGSNSTVYLISLENNYQADDGKSFTFKGFSDPNNDTKKIFPFLYKWKFHAFDDQLYCITKDKAEKINKSLSSAYDFSSIYEKVYTTTEAFKAKLSSLSPKITDKNKLKIIEQLAKVPGSNFHELLSNLDGGFKPLALIDDQSKFESTGSIQYGTPDTQNKNSPIQGWYRSPFTARPIDIDIADYVNLAIDQRKRSKNGSNIITPSVEKLNDYTYSTAYELGRLTALDDVDFGKEFYKWKCEYAMSKRILSGSNNLSYLAVSDNSTVPELPKHVLDKFNCWKQLKGIPYRYLVPDPSLLPNESVRFFQIDQNWIKAFICGAFSIGHTIEYDFSNELSSLLHFEAIKDAEGNVVMEFPSCGFLINSFAVSGWPGYEVDASNVSYTSDNIQEKNNLIDVQQRLKLDTNIELFLYTKQFNGLNFHLHPAKTHSGFLFDNNKFSKESETITAVVYPEANNEGENGPYLVDINKLADSLNANTIAEFAGKMLEGTPEVYFNIS